MSIFLYRLGGFDRPAPRARPRRRGCSCWSRSVGAPACSATDYDDSFSIPGTRVAAGPGHPRRPLRPDRRDRADPVHGEDRARSPTRRTRRPCGTIAKAVDKVKGVTRQQPADGRRPRRSTRTSGDPRRRCASRRRCPSEATLDAVQKAAKPPASSDVSTSVGGDAYKSTADPSQVPELLGLLVSFMILALTFGSLLAAGMPIITSLIGVGVTLSAVVVTSIAGDRVEHGTDPRRDARPRRRDRLRAVHPVAAPQPAGRGRRRRRVDGACPGDRGQRRRVRRRDGHHRARRPLGRADPGADRDGPRRGRCSGRRRADRADPAAGDRAAAGRAAAAESRGAPPATPAQGGAAGDAQPSQRAGVGAPLGAGRHAVPGA